METTLKKIKNLDFILDAEPVKDDKGEEVAKTQDEWVEYWRYRRNDFMSMADYYKVFKQIMHDFESKDTGSVVAAIQLKDALGFCVGVTSTRVEFEDRNDLEGMVIHNYGSERQRAVGKVLVPPHFFIGKSGSVSVNPGILGIFDKIYRGDPGLGLDMDQHAWLQELLHSSTRKPLEVKDEDCLCFLQKILDTDDDLETISAVLYSTFDYSHKGFTTNMYVNTYVPQYGALERSCSFKTQINFAEKILNVELGVLPEEKNYGYARGALYKDRWRAIGEWIHDTAYTIRDVVGNVISYTVGAGAGTLFTSLLYTSCVYPNNQPSDPSYLIAPGIVGAILGIIMTAALKDGFSSGPCDDESGKYCQGK